MDGLKKPRVPDVAPTNCFTRSEFPADRERHLSLRLVVEMIAIIERNDFAHSFTYEMERTNQGCGYAGKNRLTENGAIFLRRARTGVPVFLPLPPQVVSLLTSLPSTDKRFFFWSGHADPRSAVKSYQRSFWKLFRLANLISNAQGAR